MRCHYPACYDFVRLGTRQRVFEVCCVCMRITKNLEVPPAELRCVPLCTCHHVRFVFQEDNCIFCPQSVKNNILKPCVIVLVSSTHTPYLFACQCLHKLVVCGCVFFFLSNKLTAISIDTFITVLLMYA